MRHVSYELRGGTGNSSIFTDLLIQDLDSFVGRSVSLCNDFSESLIHFTCQ